MSERACWLLWQNPEPFCRKDFNWKKASSGEKAPKACCAGEAELGLGIDKSGIMALDPSVNAGDEIAVALGLSDAVFELDLNPQPAGLSQRDRYCQGDGKRYKKRP